MAARREALARDITSIHGDEFMRVYGYRKVWRQLLDQGWDPLEAGRDQVARIMARTRSAGRSGRPQAGHHHPRQGDGRQARPGGAQVRRPRAEPAARRRHHLRAAGGRLVRVRGVRHRRIRQKNCRLGRRLHDAHRGAAAAGAGTGHRVGAPTAGRRGACTIPATARSI